MDPGHVPAVEGVFLQGDDAEAHAQKVAGVHRAVAQVDLVAIGVPDRGRLAFEDLEADPGDLREGDRFRVEPAAVADAGLELTALPGAVDEDQEVGPAGWRPLRR